MGIDAGKSGLNFLDGLETIQCCWAKIEDMRTSVISASRTPLLNAVEENLHEQIAFCAEIDARHGFFRRRGSACGRLRLSLGYIQQDCSRPVAGV
jgi:hypothetical protein